MNSLKIVNIKVSCLFDHELRPQVVKQNGKVFTVYKHSKMLMNISGIKSAQELYKLQHRLQVKLFRIDNIMFTRKCYLNYNIKKLYQRALMLYKRKYHICYDSELQSAKGIYIIPKEKPGCSLIIYRTGSCTIMGAKNLHSKQECEEMLTSLYDSTCLME